ncbi:MAG: bifunctional riboflavin kinase/FAD synthetase [Planctomycetaceae bacterium]|nr:bifunctional riboflavin kinase/FAD synthetase [Planctomycetaceae bacterium]
MLSVPDICRHGCVAIGNFDGVHLGHQAMLAVLKDLAARQCVPAVVVTFSPHPLTVLRPEVAPCPLTTVSDRQTLLQQLGVDHVVILPVTKQLLQFTAQQFFDDVLVRDLAVRGLVEGRNFHFGRDRGGNIQTLTELCRGQGIELQVVDLVGDAGPVSSSRIRELLGAGKVAAANELLGRHYRLSSPVIRGAGRGASIGFPTANLAPPEILVPGHGVYAGIAAVDGRDFTSAIHIGPNPTFADDTSKIECWLDGYSGDLYDQTLTVRFVREIRQLKSFPSAAELVEQIQRDVEACRTAVRSLS